MFFFTFSETEWNVLGLVTEFFWPDCRISVLLVHRNSWRKTFVLKNCDPSFRTLIYKTVTVWQTFLAMLSKSNATCTKEFFEAFFGKFFQYFLEIEKRSFRPLVKKLSGGVFEKPICVSSWAFCGKPLFFKKNSFLIIIGSWAKSLHSPSIYLGGAIKVTFYVFIGTRNFSSYINFFQRVLFLRRFRTLGEKIRVFVKVLSAGLSKIVSPCP